MKLFYATGACSLSPHIVLRELGYDFELTKVDLKSKRTQAGEDFTSISPKGYVPHLVLDNGDHISEGVAIVQYLADQKPEKNLVPKAGTMERVRVQEWLNFIAAEVHKSFSPLFNGTLGPEAETLYRGKLTKAFNLISNHLKGKRFMHGENFTVVDAYLFTVLNWTGHVKFDLSPWPNLVEYHRGVADRPKVQEALKAEGLK